MSQEATALSKQEGGAARGAGAGCRAPRDRAAVGASPAWEEAGLRPYPPFPEKEAPGGALITRGALHLRAAAEQL